MTEPRDDLFRQRERYGTLLDDAAVHAGTRPARDVTRSARTLRPIRRRLVPALVAAAVVMGGATTVAVIRNFLAPPDRVAHTTSPSTGPSAFAGDVFPSELRVTAALPAGTSAWRGMAFDGHFMWTAVRNPAGNGTGGILLTRRSAETGAALSSIQVQQESVLSLAFDGAGALYAVGGGDGAVPDTTVSKVDVGSEKVVWTRTLPDACSCKIVADANGVWLGANGSSTVYRLEPKTGALVAAISLPAASTALAIVGDILEVGLRDSSRSTIDPATNTIRNTDIVRNGHSASGGPIVAVVPARVAPQTWNSWLVRSDGTVFLSIQGADGFVGPEVLPGPAIDAVSHGDSVFAVGRQQVTAASIRSGSTTYGVWTFNPTVRAFEPGDQGPNPSEDIFSQIAATDDTLWINRSGGGSVLVVRPVGPAGASTGDEEHPTAGVRARAERQLAEYDSAEIRYLKGSYGRLPRKDEALALVPTLEFRKACRDLLGVIGRTANRSRAVRIAAIDVYVRVESQRLIARTTLRDGSAVAFTRYGARVQAGEGARVQTELARECADVVKQRS